MEAKFTPGPWSIAHDGNYPRIRKHFRTDHHMDVCGPVHGYMYADDETANQAANAHLIAAAPDMYEALESLIITQEYKEEHGKDKAYELARKTSWNKVKAALAKARGEVDDDQNKRDG